MEKIIQAQEAPHSVTLTTNAKGKVQAEVKVYDADPQAAADKALAVLGHVKAQLGAQMAGD